MKKTDFCQGWTCNGKPVTLPHDATLHGVRSADAPSGSAGAYFPGGEYVYEKSFLRPDAAHVMLQFEGVYKNAKVYLNGKEAGGAAYGYLPFFVDADAYLVDGENTLRVECENVDQPDSRWYAGAGIYRPAWLWEGPADSIQPESVQISTISVAPAVIRVRSPKPVKVTVDGISGEGTDFELTIPDAKLWSEESPHLYTAHVENGADSEEIRFGVRKIEWSNKGLFINGKETLLRGGCVHHDSGILGAATYDEGEYRRVKKLKEAGFNAIRSAHNPCSRAMLEACDELGMYLMDESWDMWFHHKTPHDYAPQWREHFREDLAAMARRDFNHPCVILYSIGNEVSEPCKEEGMDATREMVALLHQLDPSRPVTAGINLMILAQSAKGKYTFDPEKGRDTDAGQQGGGMNSTMFNLITSVVGTGMNKAANSKKADAITSPVLDALDMAGYNYASGRYPLEGKAHPDRVIFGSETFPQDIAKNWEMVKKYPYLAGDFMWTAWDYIGEVGIGAWAYSEDGKGFSKPYPWLLADTGAFDILGDPNGEAFHAAAVWEKLERPAICVRPINHDRKPSKAVWRGTNAIPSWSWRGCEGKKATVEVYCDADRVELYLNGKKAGQAKVKECRATFAVRYAPGKLEAVAYDAAGRETGRSALTSAGGDLRTLLTPEKASVKPGEVVYIPVSVTDGKGVVESNADRRISVTVENGELLGFGSANPRTEERFDVGEYTTYYGRALAVVRAGKAGKLVVTANGSACEIEVAE